MVELPATTGDYIYKLFLKHGVTHAQLEAVVNDLRLNIWNHANEVTYLLSPIVEWCAWIIRRRGQ